MKKMVLALTLALALGVCGAAVAEQGVAYGVYSLGNEQPDSLKVNVDYSLDINYEHMSDCCILVDVQSCQ